LLRGECDATSAFTREIAQLATTESAKSRESDDPDLSPMIRAFRKRAQD